MKSFFGTDRLKRSRILKAILFIIIMISAVSSMSLLYKSVYAQEENQHKYAAKKRVLFISSYSYAWETVPEQIAGIKEVLNEDVVIDYKFMDSKNLTSSESVDDKALTHSHKNTLAIYKMLGQILLHLSQIQTNNSLQLVNSNNLCIIAISFEINNFGNI